MTDTMASVDSVQGDVREHLSAQRWQTAREVHDRIGRWAYRGVTHELREMADAAQIETRLGGTADRPVREYRAWK